MAETLHERALYLAGAIEVDAGRVDPADAGTTGFAFLDQFREDGATPEAAELGVLLLEFALDRVPDHPDAPDWRYRAGDVRTFLAAETESTAHLDAALAHMTAAATGDPDGWAAVETAALTATRLSAAAHDEDLSPDEVRRLTDVVDALVPAEPDRTEFLLDRAHAHRWAYVRTLDPADLDHVITAMAAALPHVDDPEDRVEALEALIAVQEERFLLTESLEPLEAALAAAVELRALVADDPERSPWARVTAAALVAARFWNSADKDDADRDEAIAEYGAVDAETGLEDRHARDYGFLRCFRGGVNQDTEDIKAGIDVLTSVPEEWLVASAIAEAHEFLVALEGPHHLWDAIDWCTRALAHPEPDSDDVLDVRTRRLEAVEMAAREFGIGAVLQRCDARAMLADADTAVRGAPAEVSPQARARLAVRSIMVRTQWMGEFYPVGDTAALRAAVRDQIDLLTEVKAAVPAEDHSVVEALSSLVDMMGTAFVGDSGAGLTGDLDNLMKLLLPDSGPSAGTPTPEGEAEQAMTRYLRRLYERVGAGGHPRELVGDLTALVWQVDALPPSEQRDLMEQMLATLSQVAGPPGDTPALPRLGDTQDGEVARLFAKANEWRAALEAGDSRQALWAYQAVERAAAGVRPGATMEFAARMVRGMTRARLSAVVPTEPAALDAAIAERETAWRAGGGVGAAVDLGSRLRLRDGAGDRAASRTTALAALVAEAGPDGDPGSAELAVIGDNVTAWCLDDDSLDDLVRVLEARRALVLAAGGGVDRPEVTGPREVRDALRAAGADVLVYLVPECDAHRGMAVVVPLDGPVRVVDLPRLATAPPARFAATRDARYAEPTPAAVRAWRASLSDVCAWAWQAAGAELVAAAGTGRLVLVPMGALGLVPWVAAWREVDGRRRYLVQDVDMSLAPSGRVLGLAAGRPAGSGAAVFVGNPERDDAPAAVVAEGLRDAFHPDGRFLGGHGQPPRPWRVSEDGAGTPEEVRAALADRPSVLHLGCRAVSDLDAPERSRVTLHDGAPLPLTEPVEADLVTLANHTATGGPHDDARTLPARFLALGARSVLATRWPAPTAHLVHLVHEHGCDSPGAALRAAQLRVLDPGFDRSELPAHLRDVVPTDPAEIEHWAALAHFGR
ncbi:CHAT domain-containing protein [Actinosynnema sp. CA-248983]